MDDSKVVWYGSHACDFCGFYGPKYLVDGKTKQGPWATMCPSCHKANGVGLGLGKGQIYELNNDGIYVKVSG